MFKPREDDRWTQERACSKWLTMLHRPLSELALGEIKRTFFYTFRDDSCFDHTQSLLPASGTFMFEPRFHEIILWTFILLVFFLLLSISSQFHLANALVLAALTEVSSVRHERKSSLAQHNFQFELRCVHLSTFSRHFRQLCACTMSGEMKTKDFEWNNNLTGLKCSAQRCIFLWLSKKV